MSGFLMADAASVRRGTARWAPHVRSCAAANARNCTNVGTHGELALFGHS